MEIIALTALIINTIALIVVTCQTIITKRTLTTTKQSVDDAKTQRQLETLPKLTWIIKVQVQLEYWEKDLRERIELLQKGINEKNNEIMQKASNTKITKPNDLSLNKFLYENMPAWLRELWMSGAQYYYDAITPLPHAFKDEKPNYDYSQNWIDERAKDSLYALSKLLEYLKDMVPTVILNTPASLSDKDFLKD